MGLPIEPRRPTLGYSKQTWIDDNPNTPLSAARMGYIEDGIEAAAAAADDASTAASDAVAAVGAGLAEAKARANHTGTQAISTVSGLQSALDGKADASHTHSISQVSDASAVGQAVVIAADAAAARAAIGAGTSSLALGTTGSTAAAGNHTHDSRYYTETETDTLLAAKADSGHTHSGMVTGSGGITKIQQITAAAFAALDPKDSATLYAVAG